MLARWPCKPALDLKVHCCGNAADWLPISIPNKVLSDLIISNESRIESSNEVTYYNRCVPGAALLGYCLARAAGLPVRACSVVGAVHDCTMSPVNVSSCGG